MAKTVRVTSVQVLAAQHLIEDAERLGEEVPALWRKIAEAKPLPADDADSRVTLRVGDTVTISGVGRLGEQEIVLTKDDLDSLLLARLRD